MKLSLLERPDGDQPLAALGLLLTGVMALAFQDSLVKLMSDQTSFWQFQALRSIGNMGFAVMLASIGGGLALLIPKNRVVVGLRSLLMVLCMFCFFSGAPFLSISQMAAGLYTYPLFVTLLAGPVLGERVGLWRWGALALGSGGAMLVLDPWSEAFSRVQLLPVMAGFLYAANILTIRRACRNESPLALAFAVAISFTVSGSIGVICLTLFPLPGAIQQSMPFVAVGWPELTGLLVGFIVLTSILNLTGNLCLSRAYQTADSSWLVPLDFSYLLFAAIWGRVLFDAWPPRQAVMGMLLIAGAGMVTAWRERVYRNRRPRPVPT